jgi:hypothetical protein
VLRRCLPVLLVTVALTGCAEARDTAARAGDCAGLVQDVAASGLSGTPSLAEAEAAVQRLDERVQQIDDAELKQATTTLRDRLQDLVDAARSADRAAAQQAAEDARAAARRTGELCGVPVDQVLRG